MGNTTRHPSRKKINKSSRNPLTPVSSLFKDRKAENPPGMIEVHAQPESLQGKYCNIATIKHSSREFILDFIFGAEGKNILISRIITSPQHAKDIYEALNKNIEIFENKFGEIVTKRSKK